MTKVLICGVCGAMGKTLLSLLEETKGEFCALCGVDIHPTALSIPVYQQFSQVVENVDLVIDFSSPDLLADRLQFALQRKIGIVVATTGFLERDFSLLREYAKEIPIFQTANFSPAVFYMQKVVQHLSKALPDFQLSIVETHHKHKKDAPSGTAKALIKDVDEDIPVFSIRGGSVVGIHEAIFFGEDETLTITHHAQSKKIFALGALQASKFLLKQTNGLFDMNDLYKNTPSD